MLDRYIFTIRGHKVMLSVHLAELYNVRVKALIQAVKRNIDRFPGDFMFRLTWEEAESLRSQIVTLKPGIPRSQFVTLESGQNIKYLPYAFTEQGVAMLSSVLKSKRAIQMNIAIMRTFVNLKQALLIHKDLAEKIGELERKTDKHDKDIQAIVEAIRDLINSTPPAHNKPKREIGFHVKSEKRTITICDLKLGNFGAALHSSWETYLI